MSATSRADRAPLLAFTSGDPAGIGPETVLGALRSGKLKGLCRPLLVGEASVWRRAGWRPGQAPLLDTGLGLGAPAYGRPSRDSGKASFSAVRLAARLAARGLVAGVVTAPISKQAWSMAAVPFTDHTDYLRAETGTDSAQMVIAAPEAGVWTVLATRHIPLRDVPRRLTTDAVLSAASALHEALRRLGRPAPRLGLCALNPHAGEEGLIGGEERSVLAPAAAAARRRGIRLSDPIPADTAWRRHLEGKFDGLVTLYHDQALIPLKAVAGLSGVNWTAGLPFIRTSPAHGTGFDRAGRGLADPAGTVAAAALAARLARAQK